MLLSSVTLTLILQPMSDRAPAARPDRVATDDLASSSHMRRHVSVVQRRSVCHFVAFMPYSTAVNSRSRTPFHRGRPAHKRSPRAA